MLQLDKVRDWAEVNKPPGWQVISMVGIRDGVGYQQYIRIDGPAGVGVVVRPDQIEVGFIREFNHDDASPEFIEGQAFAQKLSAAKPLLIETKP